MIILTLICSLLVNKKKQYRKDNGLYRFLLNFWSGVAIFCSRTKVKVSGTELIPDDTPFLIVGNHRSKFDSIITWYKLRKYKIAYVSKEANFHIPFFGTIIRKCCFLSLDRGNDRKALETVNAAIGLIRDAKMSVGIYPEGTRNTTDEPLLPFHNGVFKIAQRAGVPIVVVSVKGTRMISKNFPKKRTYTEMNIVKVIPAEEVASLKTYQLGDIIKESLTEDWNI